MSARADSAPGTATAAGPLLESVFREGALLLDERSPLSLRELVGMLLGAAVEAAFAVNRIRLAGIDLSGRELGSVRKCRVLIGRLDANSLIDTGAGRTQQRQQLRELASFSESGRLHVRAAGSEAWSPDFSVLRVRSGDTAAADRTVALVGAHYFARPQPVTGPVLTAVLCGGQAERAATRFDELWEKAYDVLPVVRAALQRLLDVG